jgi:hypothetical protein
MATFTRGTSSMFKASCTLKNNFAGAREAVLEQFARTIAATGEDIAEQTRENMTPNHFLDTGLSQDETRWEQLSRFAGQVHIPTDYALWPEVGTAHMAPRPVLTPACMQHFPARLYEHWAESSLPALKAFGGIGAIGRSDRRTGRGYA